MVVVVVVVEVVDVVVVDVVVVDVVEVVVPGTHRATGQHSCSLSTCRTYP